MTMGLSKEVFRPLKPAERKVSFSPANVISPEISSTTLAGEEARTSELTQMLFAQEKKEDGARKQPQEKTPRQDGFEPFVNPEPLENALFVNGYAGNLAQQMELNRKGVERVLKIAHLDGQVFLTSLSPDRQRSAEANPDGSVTKKRFLLWGEKIEDEHANPLRRVIPTPEGWTIEINDTRIREELEKRNLTKEKLQTEFVRQFNSQLKQGLLESIWREKCSDIKDPHLKIKKYFTIGPIFIQTVAHAPFFMATPLRATSLAVGLTILSYGAINLIGQLSNIGIRNIKNEINRLNPNYFPEKILSFRQNFDNLLEHFMPQVEIDKVVRSVFFLGFKGETLVRERKPEVK